MTMPPLELFAADAMAAFKANVSSVVPSPTAPNWDAYVKSVDVAEEEVDAADEAEVAKATATPCKKKRKFMPLHSPNKLPANEVETVVMSGPHKAKSMLAKVRDEKKKAMDAKKSLIAQNKVLKKDGQT